MALPPVADSLTYEQALAAPYLPGQQPGEQAILKAWLLDSGHAWQRFAFNVRLGTGVLLAGDHPEFARTFVRKTTQKRIDCVAFSAHGASLFEVKIQANLGGLGQILGYRHLWERDFPTWPVESAGIICHLIAPDTAAVYVRHGMPYYVMADVVLPPLTYVPPEG